MRARIPFIEMLREPACRRRDLRWLRRQFSNVARLPRDERGVAERLVELKRELIAVQGELRACKACARHHEPPHGTHEGGFCCGGSTEGVFGLQEVVALHAAGVRAHQLVTPLGAHAGCTFRGARGCSLDPGHRPVLCVVHYCREAQRELAQRGDLERLEALAHELRRGLEALGRSLRARNGDSSVPGVVLPSPPLPDDSP